MSSDEFELKAQKKAVQEKLPLKKPVATQEQATQPRQERRKKDSVRLVWDSKPKRPPSPRDIEFQTAEVVIPNPGRDEKALPLSFHDGVLGNEEIDRTQMNRLIWGDNLLAMQALLTQGYDGKIDLIYIDPPFNSQEDYNLQMSLDLQTVGKFTREISAIERLAYSDTWEAGLDSYLDMLYPRLQLIRRLLSEQGSLYVHIGPGIACYVKVMLDEVFGYGSPSAEIIWKRVTAHGDSHRWGLVHDYILWYGKTDKHKWNSQFRPYDQSYLDDKCTYTTQDGRRYQLGDLTSPHPRRKMTYEWRGHAPPANGWRYELATMERLYAEGRIELAKKAGGRPRYRRFLDEMRGYPVGSIWDDVSPVNSQASEDTGYDTQKPLSLLRRVLEASSSAGDLVADFFCGSGTTLAMAETLGRRWIGCDRGKVGIQVARARLVQQDAKPFLIENIGNYQREMIYLTGGRIYEMQRIILKLYGAAVHPTHKDLGMRQGQDGVTELVHVGYPDRPTTARKVEELARLAETLDGSGYKRLIILAWDYDYNFDQEWESRQKAMKRKLDVQVERRMIPPDVYDYLKKAKDEDDVYRLADKIVFHQKPMFRLRKPKVGKPHGGECEVTLGIDKYVVFDLPVAEKEREKLREAIKDNFAILIDYWAVDWDYDGATFRSEWQAIRGNGKRAKVVPTETTHALPAGKACTIAVRVVDVFGNDAAATCEVRT